MSARNDQAAAQAAAAQTAIANDTGIGTGTALNDEMVREYLKNHDDFLQRHPDMLDFLHVSHASGSAVSLVEKQVSVLRERNMEMRHRLTALTTNARENDQLHERTCALVLKLLEADSLAALSDLFAQAMTNDFAVDYACIILYGADEDAAGYRIETPASAKAAIGALFKGHKAVCGALREKELKFLFPAAGSEGSAAVIPLSTSEKLGLIAVGSADASRYSSSVGTLFLSHIASVIARRLPRLQQQAS